MDGTGRRNRWALVSAALIGNTDGHLMAALVSTVGTALMIRTLIISVDVPSTQAGYHLSPLLSSGCKQEERNADNQLVFTL